jgi:putative transposase
MSPSPSAASGDGNECSQACTFGLRVPPAGTRAGTSQRDVPTKALPYGWAKRYFADMEVPRRKKLPHDIPLWVDPAKEIYFVNVNCEQRSRNQLALPHVSEQLFETIRFRQERHLWWPYLFLLMPDHLHALLSFPPSDKAPESIVRKWKEWTAKELGIVWQRDFFEHRLRSDESRREKADYILDNPVRRNLVVRPEDWPYVYFGDGKRPQFGW